MGGTEVTELPIHEITISYPFAMSIHEVTSGEYQQFCDDTGKQMPSQPWIGKDYPIVNITWDDAVAYSDWLSAKTSKTYRLPSESEWEYAARAGTTTIFPFGDSIDRTDAIYADAAQISPPLAKTDRSINYNSFRLYHMPGNVREWVADSWQDDYTEAPGNGGIRNDGDTNAHVVRGGSYGDIANALRSGARIKQTTDAADNFTGFRVIQEL